MPPHRFSKPGAHLSMIPVVEDQQLVGIITLQNLMYSMTLLAEKPQAAARRG